MRVLGASKWGISSNYFVETTSKTPDVNSVVISTKPNIYLRSKILRSSNYRSRNIYFVIEHLANTEVCHFQMPVLVQEKVLGFQIPVNNLLRMNILQA